MLKISGKIRKELIEWGILAVILVLLFTTPLGKIVSSTLQRGLLATGLIQPTINDIHNAEMANFDFYLEDASGNLVDFNDFKGKTIFINFWATWCPPCIAELPDIHALYEKLDDPENVAFVMITLDKEKAKALDFMKKKEYNLPVYSLKSSLPDTYETSAIPTTYVISPEGKIVVERHGLAQYNTDKFFKLMTSGKTSN